MYKFPAASNASPFGESISAAVAVRRRPQTLNPIAGTVVMIPVAAIFLTRWFSVSAT